jgi:hypothetical protein
MDRQVGEQREHDRRVRIVDGVGRLAQAELCLHRAVRVGEERPAGADPGAERRGDFGWVDADGEHPRVGDLHLVLERDQPPEEGLLLRAPPAAVELQHGGIAAGQLREPPPVARVIGELDVREGRAGREAFECCAHGHAVSRERET